MAVVSREPRTSNTGVANEVSRISRVASGVDTLIVSVTACIPDDFMTALRQVKELASFTGQPVATPLTFADEPLVILPHSRKSWSVVLRNDAVDVQIGRGGVAGADALLRLSSWFLWSRPLDEAVDELHRFIFGTFGDLAVVKLSEVHMACDVAGVDIGSGDFLLGLVRRARKSSTVERPEQITTDGYMSRIETFAIGARAGRISAAVYDKRAELRKSGKQWLEDIWRANGWNGVDPVWRVEFRVRRKGIREFSQMQAGVGDVYQFLDAVDAMWSYLSQMWLRHVVPPEAITSRRAWELAPLSPFWSVVSLPFGCEQVAPDARVRQRRFSAEALAVQGVGCTFAAMSRLIDGGASAAMVADFFLDAVGVYLERRASTVADELARAKLRYLGCG